MRILLVDDDADFAEMVRDYLSAKGHVVALARNGKSMRRTLERSDVDVVLLDLVMPEEDGLVLTHYLREHSQAGIVILSGAGTLIDRVVLLELGADDYLQKPFELRELLARLNSLYRRLQATGWSRQPTGTVAFAGWRLDLQDRKLFSPVHREVPLTTTEFALLRALVSRPYQELSRDELMRQIKGRAVEGLGRNIDVHIARLRQKIETDPGDPALLKTVHGVGYTFCSDVVAEE